MRGRRESEKSVRRERELEERREEGKKNKEGGKRKIDNQTQSFLSN